ncbi:Clavaminate synthase-like protein [Amylocystis lapponica]|nr:Clavaminate synthase-like protein [Amylocystis lapponica]
MPGLIALPPFPEDIPTHPLLVVDYALIKAGDEDEKEKLWQAATKLGFWYLKNHGAEREVDAMFEMGNETMKLPLEEKMKFEQGDDGISFGYKAAGVAAVDEKGTLDCTEFLNVSKDDALAWPAQAHRSYPATVNARMESAVIPFTRKSVDVNTTLLGVLNEKLGLAQNSLAKKHAPEEHSRCVSRLIRTPPNTGAWSEDRALLSAHTDFGSLSFLHNRLGGLQVLAPGTDKWQYVKPLPNHAICNIGDALNIMSGGILRSNLHRVVPPPKEQAAFERFSLVFFTRPNDDVVLRALAPESPLIAEQVAKMPAGKFETGSTAKEWVTRRVKMSRIKHFKGAESWLAGRGTEDVTSLAKVAGVNSTVQTTA